MWPLSQLWLALGGLVPHVVVELRALNCGKVTVMPCSQPCDDMPLVTTSTPQTSDLLNHSTPPGRDRRCGCCHSHFSKERTEMHWCYEDYASFQDRPRQHTFCWFVSILSFSTLWNDPWIVSGHPDSCPAHAVTLLWDLNFWDHLTSLGFSFLICQMLALDEMVSKNLAWMNPPRFSGILLSYLNL